eukprot:Opistho-2@58858
MAAVGALNGDPEVTKRSQVVLTLLKYGILLLIAIVAFASRLFAVIRFESIIHEFDPWFNYRSTHHMVTHGFYEFINWFDERSWYPLGRIVGGTVYPGLMFTSGTIHWVLHALHIPIHIRDICVFLAPIFSGLTAIATFLLTSELSSTGAGLLAAAFIGIVPGYISRSVAGSYDNEGIAIFALMLTYYLWIVALKRGSMFFGALTALAYFYMVAAWGGYVFIINLIPLHAFVLLLMGRYSARLYLSYSTFYVLGTIMSMQVAFVGFQPVRTSEHMAAMGVFALLQAYSFVEYLRAHIERRSFEAIFKLTVITAAGIVFLAVVGLTYAGVIAPWTGRYYSLWDTGYAKIHIPIIASVSEHQPTAWSSFMFDLHFLVVAFPAGLWLCTQNMNDERAFIVLYAATATYFAGVMVRLMLTLTPCVCILSAIAVSSILDTYLRQEPKADGVAVDEAGSSASGAVETKERARSARQRKLREDARPWIPADARIAVSALMIVLLTQFVVHSTWVTSNAYSSPSVVLASYNPDGSKAILDDFREAYYWLRTNTPDDARIMSWWDYGYQIAGMANRTVLVDNNTWNNSHIAMVGKAMSSNESAAYTIMRGLDVDYVLVIFGGYIGYSGDDINKFLWMVRIAAGEHPKDIREAEYYSSDGQFRVDSGAPKTFVNSLMYRLCYYRFGDIQLSHRDPPGFDRTRNVEIADKNIRLTHLDEAFTSEHWLVRIYKVKDLPNEDSLGHDARVTETKAKRKAKRGKGSRGYIHNKLVFKRVGKTAAGSATATGTPPSTNTDSQE